MDVSSLLAALADPVRFRIVELLRAEPRHVSELVEATGESQPNVSRHLRTLHESGLVDRVREGKWIRYGIREEALALLAGWATGEGGRPSPERPSEPAHPERSGEGEGERFAPVRPYDREADEFFTGR